MVWKILALYFIELFTSIPLKTLPVNHESFLRINTIFARLMQHFTILSTNCESALGLLNPFSFSTVS